MFEAKSNLPYYRVTEKGAEEVRGAVIGESRWNLYLNDHELVTFMATPLNLHHLAIGFLASEGLIARLDEIASIRVNLASDCAYWFIPDLGVDETRRMSVCEEGIGSIMIRLHRSQVTLPTRRVITSGCGGGVTFDDMTHDQAPVESDLRITPALAFALMHDLIARAALYRESRGVHSSGLSDGDHLIALAEDVGRHNTLDKLRGDCMMRGLETRDRVLVSSGRISSEMITKAAKMRVPIVISRTSPTSLAVELARAWKITLIGYAQGGQMLVYSGMERVIV